MGENCTRLTVFAFYMLVVGATRVLRAGLSTWLTEVYVSKNGGRVVLGLYVRYAEFGPSVSWKIMFSA